jgi:hypothetical protein
LTDPDQLGTATTPGRSGPHEDRPGPGRALVGAGSGPGRSEPGGASAEVNGPHPALDSSNERERAAPDSDEHQRVIAAGVGS